MYKLLIVDDEQIVLDSVRFIIEKDIGGLNVETARSGREAIEIAESYRPDIVITDIRMPGISGLDVINTIKEFQRGALFIVITAYEKFDFAKEAIALGVIDYITKPLSRSAVSAAVKNAIAIKDSERKRMDLELELKEKMAYILPALESGFIYSMLFSDDHSDELSNYAKLLGIRNSGGYIMTIEFGEKNGSQELTNKIGSGIKSSKFYPMLRDIIKEDSDGLIGPVMLNRVITYVPCENNSDEYDQRMEAIRAANRIYDKINNLANVTFYIGIGKYYPSYNSAYKSYEESLRAIGYAAESNVVHINDIPLERSASSPFPEPDEKMLLKKLSTGEAETCLRLFEKIFEWVEKEYGKAPHKAVSSLTEMMVMMGRVYEEYCPGSKLNLNSMTEINDFLSITDFCKLNSYMRCRIKLICEEINRARKNNFSSVITNARNYIHDNYNKDITLELVSRHVNVSPNYFSKLFKDEIGCTFIDYLTTLRIEKAKELLGDNNCYNKEICYQIGYTDPNYFSRIFKRVMGITPTEYKASLINRS